MIEQTPREEILSIIKEIESNPSTTQRDVSEKVGISLGKTNYLLKELINKDIVKIAHFLQNPNKLKKITYILTPKGFQEKIRLTSHFLKRKELEYTALKQEWERSVAGMGSRPVKEPKTIKRMRGHEKKDSGYDDIIRKV